MFYLLPIHFQGILSEMDDRKQVCNTQDILKARGPDILQRPTCRHALHHFLIFLICKILKIECGGFRNKSTTSVGSCFTNY